MFKHDAVWYRDPSVLVARRRLAEFIPTAQMSADEKLNALVRLSVYAAVLLFIFGGGDGRVVFLPLFAMAGTATVHRYVYLSAAEPFHGVDPTSSAPAAGAGAAPTPIGSNVVHTDASSPPPAVRGGRGGSSCTRPTKHNPFMNVLPEDYKKNARRPAACTRRHDANVRKTIDRYFHSGLYRNLDDAWDRHNSQRQFYTMPSTTIPNERDRFAQWCYHIAPTLKEQHIAGGHRSALLAA